MGQATAGQAAPARTFEGEARQVVDDAGRLVVADREAIAAMPWHHDPDNPGVRHKVLWRSGEIVLGIMSLPEGGGTAPHVHGAAHHHIMVLEGSCTIVGQRLRAHSYISIPAGRSHSVADVGPGGCELFYSFRPTQTSAVVPEQVAPV